MSDTIDCETCDLDECPDTYDDSGRKEHCSCYYVPYKCCLCGKAHKDHDEDAGI